MHTFRQWLERSSGPERPELPDRPESDRLMRIIMRAGPSGVAEGDLKKQIDLPRQSIDQLLAGLLASG